MKRKYFFIMFILISISTLAQDEKNYDKGEILNEVTNILNNLSGLDYAKINEDGSFREFFIHDLVDTCNYQYFKDAKWKENKQIEFKENHLYHFSNRQGGIKYNCMFFLRKGDIKFFIALNCDLFDRPEDVISYIMPFFQKSEFDSVKRRIYNYDNFGEYRAYDIHEFMDVCNNLKKRFTKVESPARTDVPSVCVAARHELEVLVAQLKRHSKRQ